MNENITQMPTGGLGSFLTSNMDQIDDNVLAFGRGSGINSMGKIANRMANMGRNGDNELVHVKTGELIVSPEVLEKNPRLAKELTQSFQNMDENIGDYVVGSEGNSINPMTGQREFFLKGLVKGIKNLFKFVAPLVLPMLLPSIPIIGPMFAKASPFMQKVISGGIGGLLSGGGIKGAAQGALIGGLTSGLQKGFANVSDKKPFFEGFKSGIGLGANTGAEGGSFLQKMLPSTPQPGDPKFEEAFAKFSDPRLGLSPSQILDRTEAAVKPGFMDYAPAVGLATLGAGALGAFDTPEQEMPNPYGTTAKELLEKNPELYRVLYGPYMAPTRTTRDQVLVPTTSFAAKGGEMFPRKTGFIAGPGTETSDDVPAMLSDGEFVMTARAVRGLGNGSRKQGVRKMYDMMKNFEGSVPA